MISIKLVIFHALIGNLVSSRKPYHTCHKAWDNWLSSQINWLWKNPQFSLALLKIEDISKLGDVGSMWSNNIVGMGSMLCWKGRVLLLFWDWLSSTLCGREVTNLIYWWQNCMSWIQIIVSLLKYDSCLVLQMIW